ncbi:MAG: hypothetical protein ACRDUY_11490 [Nitriliruptorales bacterium]
MNEDPSQSRRDEPEPDRTDQDQEPTMNATIKLTVPPDQTPAEEAELVASVAAAIAETTGADRIDFELESPEDVSYQAVHRRTHASDRWNR